jgi:hypothetical protein
MFGASCLKQHMLKYKQLEVGCYQFRIISYANHNTPSLLFCRLIQRVQAEVTSGTKQQNLKHFIQDYTETIKMCRQ